MVDKGTAALAILDGLLAVTRNAGARGGLSAVRSVLQEFVQRAIEDNGLWQRYESEFRHAMGLRQRLKAAMDMRGATEAEMLDMAAIIIETATAEARQGASGSAAEPGSVCAYTAGSGSGADACA